MYLILSAVGTVQLVRWLFAMVDFIERGDHRVQTRKTQ